MFKDALHTGRIYKQTWTIHDAVPKHHSAYNNSTNTDLSSLVRALGQDEWISFQIKKKFVEKKPPKCSALDGLETTGEISTSQSADHSVSHSVLMNCSISEDILIFMIKARLQCLPTMYNLSIWYPSKYNSYCLLHENQQDNETVAHILNGCCCYKGLYVSRHDRLVDLIVRTWKQYIKTVRFTSTLLLNWAGYVTTHITETILKTSQTLLTLWLWTRLWRLYLLLRLAALLICIWIPAIFPNCWNINHWLKPSINLTISAS